MKKKEKGITLVALIVTIIMMLILAGVVMSLIIGENGIFQKSEQSAGIYNKQEAAEKINLKITHTQMRVYAKSQRMPTLQEIANDFCGDEEVEYVELESKRVASIDKVDIGEAKSFFTKLKRYPYEFEINSSLQLASIDGVDVIASNGNNNDVTISMTREELQNLIDTSINSKLDNYSTTEQVIGTWIDGKPIYRKVIDGISYTPTSYQWTTSAVTIENVERVVKCGLAQSGMGIAYAFLSRCQNNRIEVWNCLQQSYTYQTMVVEYTKTTDTVPNN